MAHYSVKMRAWQDRNGKSCHISGAERIVSEEYVAECVHYMQHRAWSHPKGRPDGVQIKTEKVLPEELLHVPLLATNSYAGKTVAEGLGIMQELLQSVGVGDADQLVAELTRVGNMRGAILWGIRQQRRLEKDPERGVRVTYMDYANDVGRIDCHTKNHYREALALASKVCFHPCVVAEICISDDPDYVTGYVANRDLGYCRVTPLKEKGIARGGRIIVFDGSDDEVAECIHYLEKQKVLVDENN